MDYFQYPINTKMLLRKKASLKKELLLENTVWIHKKIAVLGGSTINEVVDQLELFLLYYGIKPQFYCSDYGRYWQDAVFGNPSLDAFKPDIVYIHTSWRNIERFPDISDTDESINELLLKEYERFVAMWKALEAKFDCTIIQNNFDRPNYRLMGNRDIWDFHGRSNYIVCLNQKFYEYARVHSSFYINDIDYLAADFGLEKWGSQIYWHLYKYAMCMEAVPYVAASVANIIKSLYGKNRKALVLDLDNTLWGGCIGDDGLEGIVVGMEMPEGQVYAEFQEYCRNLKRMGVVLAVDSKNDMENALAGLNHSGGILKPEDFVSIKANWKPKDQNLKQIMDELSLGEDSFVFIDDNPAEREIVSRQMKQVAVPDMNGAESYIKYIDRNGYFEATVLSEEDHRRTELYKARAQAAEACATFADYGEYLKSLQMSAEIYQFRPEYYRRIAQLTNKTNQFNLTTLRCTEDDIRFMAENINVICLYGKLRDKFGDNGIVTAVAGEQRGDHLHIKLWLMSCRVLKRGMEDAMMDILVSQAADRGIKYIIGYYYASPKNQMVKNFYADMGFEQIHFESDENTIWKLELAAYKPRNIYIQFHMCKSGLQL